MIVIASLAAATVAAATVTAAVAAASASAQNQNATESVRPCPRARASGRVEEAAMISQKPVRDGATSLRPLKRSELRKKGEARYEIFEPS